MSAETIPSEVVDQVADIIDQNELGYSITLTRLVDGIETWTLAMDGETHEFDFREDAAEVVATKRRRLQAARVIEATAAILATRPAEPAAPVAEAGDGDVAASLAHLNIGYLYGIADALEHTDFNRAGDIRQCLLQVVKGLSASAATLEAERARADAAEQRAADALASIKELEFGAGFETAFDAVVRPGSRYENWMPADDPAEIVTDLYNDLEDALARAEKAEDWQPIETAPKGKNGIAFMMLSFGPPGDQTVSEGLHFNGRFYAASVFHKANPSDGRHFVFREHEVRPTHWRPTLAPPRDLSQGGQP